MLTTEQLERLKRLELNTKTITSLNTIGRGDQVILRVVNPLSGEMTPVTWIDLFLGYDKELPFPPLVESAKIFGLAEAVIFFNMFAQLTPSPLESANAIQLKSIVYGINPNNRAWLRKNKLPTKKELQSHRQREALKGAVYYRKKQHLDLRQRFVKAYWQYGLQPIAAMYAAQYKNEVLPIDLGRTILSDCELAVKGNTVQMWLTPGTMLTDWLSITESKATAKWLSTQINRLVAKELLK